jgi:hypothetical protein
VKHLSDLPAVRALLRPHADGHPASAVLARVDREGHPTRYDGQWNAGALAQLVTNADVCPAGRLMVESQGERLDFPAPAQIEPD